MKGTLRILVADDHEMVRRGLRSLLQPHPGWTVCGEAVDGRQAVDMARELNPDIVILDLTMPLLSGLEATSRIHKALPRCEILILTMHDSEQLMRDVLTAGARGYVLKADAGSLIVTAVEALSRHQPFFTSGLSDILLKSYLDREGTTGQAAPDSGILTPRECEIVQLVAEGKSSKEIAAIAGISDQTVETHRANLMRKLNIHSLSEIVRYAIRNKMIEA